jgi:integrase/recombinase XerD
MRIGEVLELRHNDIAAAERQVILMRRDNANGADTAAAMTPESPSLQGFSAIHGS